MLDEKHESEPPGDGESVPSHNSRAQNDHVRDDLARDDLVRNDLARDDLARDDLAQEITRLAGHINAINYRFIKLLAAFDQQGGWQVDGVKSFAHWLNWTCGIGDNSAREKVRVARALPDLPQIDEAFRTGEISYTKVRAMTRVATPENESLLLMIAQYGTAEHVEQTVRKYRRCKRLETPVEDQTPSFECFQDYDGMACITLKLPAEEAELLFNAVEKMRQAIRRDRSCREHSCEVPENVSAETIIDGNVSAETSVTEAGAALNVSAETSANKSGAVSNVSAETFETGIGDTEIGPLETLEDPPPTFAQDRAAAFVKIIEHYLATSNGGAKTLNGAERYEVILHVNVDEPHGCLEGNGFVTPEVAKRLACDARVTLASEDKQGNVLNIGRRSRTISRAMRTALQIRDDGCQFPNCYQQRWTDAHHIKHWADGGETSLDNLVTLCRHHHRLLHQGDYRISKEDGKLVFYNQQAIPIYRMRYPQFYPINPERVIGEVMLTHSQEGITIDANTAVTQWRGESIDYHDAIGALYRLDNQTTQAS